ncbi:myb/SANT-like DNA-binding domain-containing protein 4 [Mytilus edulis]|uniref:myb/SANT-like DNA-binding domain-containing protein 4 n=1 Tax=Mytilus edulis TaxID=6550 RepID=UPI0039EEEE9D
MSRKRSQNFTESELQVLLDAVEKNKSVIFSKLSNVITNSAKKKIWEKICSTINATNHTDYKRTVEEIRKKWTTYMSSTKKAASSNRREARKTGGGLPPEEFTPLQDKVVGIIGETPIEGIEGGTDTGSVPSGDGKPSCSFWTESPKNSYMTGESPIAKSAMKSNKILEDKTTLSFIDIETRRLKTEQERLGVEK